MVQESSASECVSLPEILSRLPPEPSQLPTELLVTVLYPLITPHKESRDHHLLITTRSTTPTVRVLRDVTHCMMLIVAYDPCPGFENVCCVGGGEYVAS